MSLIEINSVFVCNTIFSISFRNVFYFRDTKINMFDRDIFKPFELSIWIILFLIILLFSYLLKILFKYEQKELRSGSSSTAILSLGAFCQQSIGNKIIMNSTRILIIFLFVTSALVYNFYTSLLISALLDDKTDTSLKQINELTESNISIGFLNSTVLLNLLQVCLLIIRVKKCNFIKSFSFILGFNRKAFSTISKSKSC